MRELGEYIVSVCAAAFVCGIVNGMMPKGAAKDLLKLVGGLFLAFTVIRPVANIRLPELAEITESWQQEARDAAEAGEEMAMESAVDSIKNQLEAYILDKARELRLILTVEVSLEENSLLPDMVRLSGDASPNARQQMLTFLQQELGLSEEDIVWTGPI